VHWERARRFAGAQAQRSRLRRVLHARSARRGQGVAARQDHGKRALQERGPRRAGSAHRCRIRAARGHPGRLGGHAAVRPHGHGPCRPYPGRHPRVQGSWQHPGSGLDGRGAQGHGVLLLDRRHPGSDQGRYPHRDHLAVRRRTGGPGPLRTRHQGQGGWGTLPREPDAGHGRHEVPHGDPHASGQARARPTLPVHEHRRRTARRVRGRGRPAGRGVTTPP